MYDSSPNPIAGHELNRAELDKLDRIGRILASAFSRAGSDDVCLCQAKGNGDGRTISFHAGPGEPAIISFTAIAFLASNSTELSRMIESHMGQIKEK